MTDAGKNRLGREEALKLARSVKRIVTGRGKNSVVLDVTKGALDDETLVGHILGPTGNLKAPTLRVGDTLLVGFNEEAYKQMFGA